jgi:hypothetical protein
MSLGDVNALNAGLNLEGATIPSTPSARFAWDVERAEPRSRDNRGQLDEKKMA